MLPVGQRDMHREDWRCQHYLTLLSVVVVHSSVSQKLGTVRSCQQPSPHQSQYSVVLPTGQYAVQSVSSDFFFLFQPGTLIFMLLNVHAFIYAINNFNMTLKVHGNAYPCAPQKST